MKTEEAITAVLEGGTGASPLGSHAFLDEFALAYHRAVADRLRAEPGAVSGHARRNLDRWTEGDAFGPGDLASLEEWRRILGEADVDQLIEIITNISNDGQRLRSSSLPVIGGSQSLHGVTPHVPDIVKRSVECDLLLLAAGPPAFRAVIEQIGVASSFAGDARLLRRRGRASSSRRDPRTTCGPFSSC